MPNNCLKKMSEASQHCQLLWIKFPDLKSIAQNWQNQHVKQLAYRMGVGQAQEVAAPAHGSLTFFAAAARNSA